MDQVVMQWRHSFPFMFPFISVKRMACQLLYMRNGWCWKAPESHSDLTFHLSSFIHLVIVDYTLMRWQRFNGKWLIACTLTPVGKTVTLPYGGIPFISMSTTGVYPALSIHSTTSSTSIIYHQNTPVLHVCKLLLYQCQLGCSRLSSAF